MPSSNVPQRSGIYVEEEVKRLQGPEVMEDSKETVKTSAHMNPDWQYAQDLRAQVPVRWGPITERRKWTKAPTLNQGASCN